MIRRRNDDMIAMYENGKTTEEIAVKHGLTSRGVNYVLRKEGVEARKRRRSNKYTIDNEFFSEWSNEMAYVLGFVITDGNISGNNLTISQVDRDILVSINNAMESDYPIRERKNGRGVLYTLSIHRKQLVEDLKKLGVWEAKSHTVEMPYVPVEYIPHFIRGVIDGDGWVQDRGYVMNVTGASKSFIYSLHDIFNEFGVNGRVTQQGNAYRAWVSGKYGVISLGKWIYESKGDLFLERKRERFFVNCEDKKTSA